MDKSIEDFFLFFEGSIGATSDGRDCLAGNGGGISLSSVELMVGEMVKEDIEGL